MRDLALGGADCHDGNALSAMTKHADLDRSMLQVWPPFFLFWASLPPILAKTPSCATVRWLDFGESNSMEPIQSEKNQFNLRTPLNSPPFLLRY